MHFTYFQYISLHSPRMNIKKISIFNFFPFFVTPNALLKKYMLGLVACRAKLTPMCTTATVELHMYAKGDAHFCPFVLVVSDQKS